MRPMATNFAARTLIAVVLLTVAVPCSAQNPTGLQLCQHQGIQHSAAEALGEWAQNYPFARVIIGKDAIYGTFDGIEVAVENADLVVCRASYQLVKPARDGSAYRVGIPQFFYRVIRNDPGYSVRLVDMPESLDGSDMPSRELLSRFTIDGRPYTDVLAENQRRLQRRDRK